MEPEVTEWEQAKARYQVLAVTLRELVRSPGWDTYVKLLEDSEHQHIERLIGHPDARIAGVIEGLRTAYHLPQQIIERAEKL